MNVADLAFRPSFFPQLSSLSPKDNLISDELTSSPFGLLNSSSVSLVRLRASWGRSEVSITPLEKSSARRDGRSARLATELGRYDCQTVS